MGEPYLFFIVDHPKTLQINSLVLFLRFSRVNIASVKWYDDGLASLDKLATRNSELTSVSTHGKETVELPF